VVVAGGNALGRRWKGQRDDYGSGEGMVSLALAGPSHPLYLGGPTALPPSPNQLSGVETVSGWTPPPKPT
jgi:hypothetical protein